MNLALQEPLFFYGAGGEGNDNSPPSQPALSHLPPAGALKSSPHLASLPPTRASSVTSGQALSVSCSEFPHLAQGCGRMPAGVGETVIHYYSTTSGGERSSVCVWIYR